MTDKLKAKLLQLAHQVEQQPENISDQALFDAIKQLYESAVVIQHLLAVNDPKNASDLQLQETDLRKALARFEIETPPENPVATSEQHEEIPPLMDTIKNMVTEMPESQILNELHETEDSPLFVKKDPSPTTTNISTIKEETPASPPQKKNLNDQYSTTLKIDRNDQLAFINHLFNSNPTDYQRALQQIVSMKTWEEVDYFVHQILKPDYDHWKGKEFYETRFLSVLNGYFTN